MTKTTDLPCQDAVAELIEAATKAQTALACAKYLLIKYTPYHAWMPRLVRDIDELKASIDRAKGLQ